MLSEKKTQSSLISLDVGVPLPPHLVENDCKLGSDQMSWYKEWEKNSLSFIPKNGACADTPPIVFHDEPQIVQQRGKVSSTAYSPSLEITFPKISFPPVVTASPLNEASFTRNFQLTDPQESPPLGFDRNHSQESGSVEDSGRFSRSSAWTPSESFKRYGGILTFEDFLINESHRMYEECCANREQCVKDRAMLLESSRLHANGVKSGLAAAGVTLFTLVGFGCFSGSELSVLVGAGITGLSATVFYFYRICVDAANSAAPSSYDPETDD